MNQKLSSEPESEMDSSLESRVDANQRLISIGAVTGSVMLALQHILIEAHVRGTVPKLVIVASAGGWLLFLYAFWQNRRLFKSEQGKVFAAQLTGDERLMSIRNEAFTFGFAAMIMIQVGLIILWSGSSDAVQHVLSIPVSTTVTMATGITAAVLRYQARAGR